MCVPAGTAGEGMPCTNVNDCQEGFMCDGDVCRAVCCNGSSDSCPVGQSCLISLTDSDMNPTGVGLCRFPDTCDLLAQTGCPAGQGCYPAGGDGSVLCSAPGSVADGTACSFTNDCAIGSVCAGPSGSATCRKTCDRTGGDPMCPDGETCGGVGGFPENVGVCG